MVLSRVRSVSAAFILFAVLGGLATQRAHAAGSGMQVTIAARYCDRYTDIFANRARNNIMESLKNLGPDTPYEAGEPIGPGNEDLPPQSRCKPLSNWTFTLGTGYRSLAVAGPWGNLSIVTGAYTAPSIVTKDSVPLLNNAGQQTGQQIAGATTIELTQDQANRAAKANSLWLQGGTPHDPILNQQFPDEYGFGALRCAIDDLNGDNVEWISFPQGSHHVFCYAYYVKPPPTSGTIIVRKQIDAPVGTSPTSFAFNGNISFNAGGAFGITAGLNAPGSTTFYRAEVTGTTLPWSFAEKVPQGWTLTGISCVSQSGGSSTTTDLATARTVVRLAANDVVTCTYTDRLTPPPAGLLLSKVSLGSVGTFDWDVTPAGGGVAKHVSATTRVQGVEVSGSPSLTLDPGAYAIQESLPASDRGNWKLTEARCNGEIVPDVQPLKITLASNEGAFCTFFNAFHPNGTIHIRKRTIGALGTVGFVIRPETGPTASYEQHATTTAENEAVLAKGDDTSALRLGSYSIQETTPTETAVGYWTLDSVTCDGVPVGGAQGRVVITLTVDRPDADCTFTDRFTPGATPPTPPTPPVPETPGSGVSPESSPSADLVLVKHASPTTVATGQAVRYTVKLTNHGPDSAQNVTVSEILPTRLIPLTVVPSKGTCRRLRPVICRVGTLADGETVTFQATARYLRPGTHANTAAAVTSTFDPRLGDNVARAGISVRPRARPRPRFVG